MDGILPLWKERGMTSHDCVFKVRKILKMKKVGHGGTLDPNVDGLLPICLGKGTKLLDLLHEQPKVYYGEITLGQATTTEDSDGEVIATKEVLEPVSVEAIDQMMAQMTGEMVQVPPMYSAVKVNGRRLYEYAREGIEVERPERMVQIDEFKRTSEVIYDEATKTQKWSFTVKCSKGTYVRTLAVDLGQKLGYPAYMSNLTRLQSGGFTPNEAVTLEQLEQAMADDKVAQLIQPLEEVVRSLPRVNLTEREFQKVSNGMRFKTAQFPEFEGELLALFYQQKVVAIYEYTSADRYELKPYRMLRNQKEDLK